MTDSLFTLIAEDYVEQFCQPGKEAITCKYLTVSIRDKGATYTCEKFTGTGRLIDQRTDMSAKGDNCEGHRGESAAPG